MSYIKLNRLILICIIKRVLITLVNIGYITFKYYERAHTRIVFSCQNYITTQTLFYFYTMER